MIRWRSNSTSLLRQNKLPDMYRILCSHSLYINKNMASWNINSCFVILCLFLVLHEWSFHPAAIHTVHTRNVSCSKTRCYDTIEAIYVKSFLFMYLFVYIDIYLSVYLSNYFYVIRNRNMFNYCCLVNVIHVVTSIYLVELYRSRNLHRQMQKRRHTLQWVR